MGKIGFKSYQQDENKDDDKLSKTAKTTPAQLAFKKFITSRYEPFGSTKKMVFRTSRELQYECREMCEPSLPDVAIVMEQLAYKSDQFCGYYCWVLYEPNDPVY